jgi:hypothetical protein
MIERAKGEEEEKENDEVHYMLNLILNRRWHSNDQ